MGRSNVIPSGVEIFVGLVKWTPNFALFGRIGGGETSSILHVSLITAGGGRNADASTSRGLGA
jgi:hypothetical protein